MSKFSLEKCVSTSSPFPLPFFLLPNAISLPVWARRHHLIVVYKTAFYSFYLPVALAMRMSGVTTQSSYDAALKILLPLGEYFQVQDDYLDCYGAPEQIGKIGTDILDNKCSWNINVALAKVTPEQRKVLDVSFELALSLGFGRKLNWTDA